MAACLCKKYYVRKTEALHSADAHSWWKKTKQFMDCKQPNPFQNLQRQHPNLSLADEINDFFVPVSEHLPLFKNDQCSTIISEHTQAYVILSAEIESRLSRINVHKSPGPDG